MNKDLFEKKAKVFFFLFHLTYNSSKSERNENRRGADSEGMNGKKGYRDKCQAYIHNKQVVQAENG